LETDTDLKFRYLENALPALNNVLLFGRQSTSNTSSTSGRTTTKEQKGGTKQNDLRGVMERLGQALFGIFKKIFGSYFSRLHGVCDEQGQ